MTAPNQPPLRLTGSRHLSTRLVLSTLTGRPILITKIRPHSPSSPGLAPHEVSLLRLLDAITNGSRIELSQSGTTLLYRPGLIVGSGAPGVGAGGGGADGSANKARRVIRHEVGPQVRRGASYFLVPLCVLAPFSKAPVHAVLHGAGVVTGATSRAAGADVSVDTVRTAVLPLFERFGIMVNIELRVVRRACEAVDAAAAERGAGGEVHLLFGHQVRLPKTLHWLNPGRVKRVRGVAYATGVAGANNARTIEAARGVLNPLVPDTYVFSDVSGAPPAAKDARETPGGEAAGQRRPGIGFGISLVAESSTGCIYSADTAAPPDGGVPAEDVGRRAALQLLEVIARGGCVQPLGMPVVMILMAMGSEDVGRVRLGREVVGSEEWVMLAREVRALGGRGWGLRDVDEEGKGDGDVVVSVVGRGVGNVGRKIA
ncbi:18S rRNA biogenesis protein RCL1 [Lineolata rhizophorae]|uniref:18S rRNA biogenesis protein RCL1 n=1 Tax=Lineolata rhizophorae TaxID=578093 RepID=A0A6A6P7G5_9PEZI|nr:18S rRNA biogenesis protein RCL1 [Lineolata rhizophorae]